MREQLEYAIQWESSAKFFFDEKNYHWMVKHIKDYDTVVEIGCGTGYSTLALAEAGHKVIAIDKNNECIKKAKALIEDSEFQEAVTFMIGDITDESFRQALLCDIEFDVVICWNIGSYWSKKMMEHYLPYLLKYGLTREQIAANPESSYAEYIIWEACRLAADKNIPVHLIERTGQKINMFNDTYYKLLKNEFGFKNISYDNVKAKTLSGNGRVLTVEGKPDFSGVVDIILTSILFR